ncbi:MAG: TIGR02281 family clan AA aspartic protease [Pseudomonadota bacterium]
MLRHVVFLGFCGAVALMFGTYVDQRLEPAQDGAQIQTVETAPEAPKAQPVRLSGVERVRRDPQGHYVGRFQLNNHRVNGLIDTGATVIAINESVARRAGIYLRREDFKYTAQTANGPVKAAMATIGDVQLGQIRISDVDAMVLPDESLGIVLIGMSFMNRLRGFEYDNGQLVLRR